MKVIKEVTIVNESKLRLDTDASKGDIIDLTLLNKVDTSIILEKINQARDEEFNKKFREYELRFKAESEAAVLKAKSGLNDEITKLKVDIKNIEGQTESKLKLQHQTEINTLKQELILEQNKLKNLEEMSKKNIESALIKKENDLNFKIKDLEYLIKENEKDKTLAVKEREIELTKQINQLEKEVGNLRLLKSSLNVKMLGEALEVWCNNEFVNAAINGFETCTWDKDNEVIKKPGEITGSKADYVFKVYATADKKEEDLLTSVILEMKSESPTTISKRKNKEFYEKLDKDRRKKNAEYALLISELEWEHDNDVPIRRIQEYDKMYLVRPQYFINFLGLIASLALKYKEILVESNKEALKFKDIQDILDEFEEMKNDILDKSLTYLEREINEVSKNADQIISLSRKIKTSTDKITERMINTVRNKIDGFKINRVIKKIENIEE